jgi:hypothetical protein
MHNETISKIKIETMIDEIHDRKVTIGQSIYDYIDDKEEILIEFIESISNMDQFYLYIHDQCDNKF